MVALTGELGEPPASIVDLWAIAALRGIAIEDGALSLGALTTYTDMRRSALVREQLPVARRGGRDDRGGADPEPRHARGQHRECVAGRRHAAGPARRRRDIRARLDPRRARGPGRSVLDGVSQDRPGPRRARRADPDPARDRSRAALPQGRHAPGPVDQQGRHGDRLAERQRSARTAARDRGPADGLSRRRRSARSPRRPSGPAPPRRLSRVGPRSRSRRTSRRRPWPANCGRSTTSARPRSYRRLSPRASSIDSCARPAAGDGGRGG